MYQKMFNQTQKLESKGKHSKAGDHDMPKVWDFSMTELYRIASSSNNELIFIFYVILFSSGSGVT